MQRPNSKILGSILIDVYEGNQTFSTFKGDVPANVLMGIKVSLPRDYHTYLAALSVANMEAIAEKVRVRKAKEVEEERQRMAIKQEKEKAILKYRQDLEKAEVELKKVRHTVMTELTQVEKRRVDKQLLEAEKVVADLKKDEPEGLDEV
jgi:hypothetical protein